MIQIPIHWTKLDPELETALHKYLTDKDLSGREMIIIKIYLESWTTFKGFTIEKEKKEEILTAIEKATTNNDLNKIYDLLLGEGIDPI
jgi:hypothetical protein